MGLVDAVANGYDAARFLARVNQIVGLRGVAQHIFEHIQGNRFGSAPVPVNIVGAQAEAGHFLQEVILFVGQFRRSYHTNRALVRFEVRSYHL